MEETAPRSELVNPTEKLNASPSTTKINNKPRLWSPKAAAASLGLEEDAFKTAEESFVRKIRFAREADVSGGEDEAVFLRFYNEFCSQSALFSKEGIELKELFKWENLKNGQLSLRTGKVLQNRHLKVLSTILMLAVEREQEEYRKLMQLAEALCIDEFGGAAVVEDGFKERKKYTEGLADEAILELKALCHEHLHAKRLYISSLKKIRSGAVYALFQSNHLYGRLRKLSRKLAHARGDGLNEPEDDEHSERDDSDEQQSSDHEMQQ